MLRTQDKKDLKESNRSLYDILEDAKEKNREIANMVPKIEDATMRENIKGISDTVTKIINTIEKKPKKYDKMTTFFDYYLPKTIRILKQYDEIENQSLSAEETKKFMKQTQKMIDKINKAFNSQLANLYQADIVDTGAEMKVFDSMLKADGYDTSSDFQETKKENKEDGKIEE